MGDSQVSLQIVSPKLLGQINQKDPVALTLLGKTTGELVCQKLGGGRVRGGVLSERIKFKMFI